jgi:hypothetical protein
MREFDRAAVDVAASQVGRKQRALVWRLVRVRSGQENDPLRSSERRRMRR